MQRLSKIIVYKMLFPLKMQGVKWKLSTGSAPRKQYDFCSTFAKHELSVCHKFYFTTGVDQHNVHWKKEMLAIASLKLD